MKKLYWLIIMLMACRVCVGQYNLVPNSSFEQVDTCPDNGGQLEYATHWINPMIHSSPDYFDSCSNSLGVPVNGYGYENAHTGFAYVGIITAAHNQFVSGWENYREYVEIELTDSLIQGSEYCVRFYVSAADSVCYVADKIGIYFSPSLVADTCTICNLAFIPQIETNSLGNFNIRFGWTEIDGSYIANGGEKFIVIGNFRDSTQTTYSYTGWTSTCPSNRWWAYYYIDDILLTPCDSLVGLEDMSLKTDFKISPNPFTDNLTITLNKKEPVEINLYDVVGRKLLQQTFTTSTTLNTSQLAKGIYIYEVRSGGGVIKKGKVVKE